MTLADIARVEEGYTQSGIISRYNGLPAIELAVKMFGNSDIMQIADEVDVEIEAFRNQLPVGVELVIWNDSSVYIKERLGYYSITA